MTSQLIRLANWHPTDTVLYFKPAYLESRRHTSNLQASLYFQVRSCTMLFVVFLKHYHTRSIKRLEIQISVFLARCTLVFSISCFWIKLSLFHRFEAGVANDIPMRLSLRMTVSFFVSLHFVMERNVLFLIKKNVFEPFPSRVKIDINNVAWYLPVSRFIFIFAKGCE